MSINDFARDEKANLRRLSRDLRIGEFTFDQLRPHFIPKTSGKDRLICVPTVKDRIVQRALLDCLSSKYGARFSNKISYGFVKGRTVEQAATVACALRSQHPWVFKTDITSFFDRVDRNQLTRRIEKTIREKSLHNLLFGAVNCEVFALSQYVEKRIVLSKVSGEARTFLGLR